MRDDLFEYHAPTIEQTERITKVRAAYKALYDVITEEIRNGRERALAITNLEQSSMWANKAIVFEDEP